MLYRGRYQLATTDALYSDGLKYLPALEACKALGADVSRFKNVLILGAGLGSMARILSSKGDHPFCTLVDIDQVVLEWTMELADFDSSYVNPVCEDAAAFIARDAGSYDFIFIDIFIGRNVPEFVSSRQFLEACKARLSPNGRLALNYIINDKGDWDRIKQLFGDIFPGHKVVSRSINRILVV